MSYATSSTLIAPFFRDTALQVVLLGEEAEIPDAQHWHQTGIRLVEELRSGLAESGLPSALVDQISYAQCALLDESALNRATRASSGARDVWEAEPLQVRFFGNYSAGEVLFERMATLLRQPAPDAALLETYLIILRLGFLGRFTAIQDADRQNLLQALERALPSVRLPELHIEEGKASWWLRLSVLGLCWWTLIALVGALLLWLLLDHQLDALVAGVTQVKGHS